MMFLFLFSSCSSRLAKAGELQLRVLHEAVELQATVLVGLQEKVGSVPLLAPPHTSPHLPVPPFDAVGPLSPAALPLLVLEAGVLVAHLQGERGEEGRGGKGGIVGKEERGGKEREENMERWNMV